MDNSTKETIGCFGVLAGIVVILWLVSSIFSKPSLPPMSDAELNSFIAKHKAEERQRCIDTIRKSIPHMPSDMQKYAREAISKC
jgi:hypothetical protein